jgi:hypothetical protein
MTGPDANLTKNIMASCVFKTIVNGIYVCRLDVLQMSILKFEINSKV